MRLTRLLIVSLFLFFFAFEMQTQVFAQANITPAQAQQRCANSNDIPTCVRCLTDGAYFVANQNLCFSVWNQGQLGGPIPLEATNQSAAMGANYGTGTVSLETTVFNKPASINGSTPVIHGSVFGSLAGGILGLIVPGVNGAAPLAYKGADGKITTVSFAPSAIDSLTNLTAQIVGKPQISSSEYVADVINTIRNPLGAQTAYAQGLGFSSLAPALSLWKLFRNVAYFFFVVIFLVIGFMIMFRSKIGGQAAVTVQQALPKIVVSLLLVTFSYAIAGLMIDVMYLVIYLCIGIFSPYFPGGIVGGSTAGATSLVDIAFKNNIVKNVFDMIGNGVVGNVAGAVGNIATGALGLSEQNFGGFVVQGASNIIFTLILAVAILVALFRIFFALLQAYIFIFFSVIFAPIQLLLGAIPGQNTFGAWIRGLLENLLVFPVIIVMIFIAYFFTVGPFGVQNTNGGGQNLGFSAPQLSSNQGADGFRVYQSLLALGALLAMPEVLKITKGLMSGKLDLSMGQLGKNLLQGNKYAAPLVGLGAGAVGGAALGAYYGKRSGEGILSGMWSGAKDARGNIRGGLRRNVPEGWNKGMGAAKIIDRLQTGQLLDPDNVAKQLDRIAKASESKGSSGGKSDSSGNAKPLPFDENDWGS